MPTLIELTEQQQEQRVYTVDNRDSNSRYKADNLYESGAWWLIGRFVAFRPKGRGFESRSSRHVGTLGKSLTRSCLWRFGVKLRYSIRDVSGAPMNSSGLEEAL